MKTAGRENPNHGVVGPHSRAHGAVGQNRSRSIRRAAKQEKFRPTGKCFFLTLPFIELGFLLKHGLKHRRAITTTKRGFSVPKLRYSRAIFWTKLGTINLDRSEEHT